MATKKPKSKPLDRRVLVKMRRDVHYLLRAGFGYQAIVDACARRSTGWWKWVESGKWREIHPVQADADILAAVARVVRNEHKMNADERASLRSAIQHISMAQSDLGKVQSSIERRRK